MSSSERNIDGVRAEALYIDVDRMSFFNGSMKCRIGPHLKADTNGEGVHAYIGRVYELELTCS